MAQTAAQVQVGYDGGFYIADAYPGTPPGDASSALTGYTEVGYISDAGVTVAHEEDNTEIVAWQRADVVRKTVTKSDLSYQFTVIETNKAAVELYYATAMETGDLALQEKGFQPVRMSAVLDVIDGDYLHRMYLPECEVTNRGDISFVTEDAIGYDVTVTAYPDSNQVKTYHYWSEALVNVTRGIAATSRALKSE